MLELRQRYEGYLQRPQVRSLLNTLRYAEGTAGKEGYRTMFGGRKFDVSKGWKHPDKVISSGGYNSAAAGGYQFLPGTWQDAAKALGLSDFSPKSQDLAALYLVERRGALDPFLKGEKFGTVINKLAPEWASLPTSGGGSYYGQPVKKLSDLQQYYEQQKQKIAGQIPTLNQSQQLQQTQANQKLNGVPNINIFIGDRQKQSSKNVFQDFLEKFSRKTFARPQSSVPTVGDISQQLLGTESVNYFS